jgi:hypothetical protein
MKGHAADLTEEAVVASTLLAFIQDMLDLNFDEATSNPMIFRHSQSFQKNSGTVPRLGHASFLLKPFQFIIH